MKYIELSIERELDFLIKYGLTPDELFVIKLIFYAQDEHPEYLSRFYSEGNFTLPLRDILISLQNKGIINKTYKIQDSGKVFNPKDVDFNKLVIKGFLQHSEELGMDLFMHYPSNITIDGKIYSLRNITKLYKSIDEMSFNYGKAIGFNPEKHNEVMELLERAKENNWIKSGICDFIESRKWLDIKELIDNGQETFDTIALV